MRLSLLEIGIILLFLIGIFSLFELNKNHIEIKYKWHDMYVNNRIAKVVSKECGNCPITDKILIASSILNRMNDDRFPSNIDDVIKNQYCISDTFDVESYQIAQMVMKGLVRDYNVLYFFNPKTATDVKFINWIRNNHDLIVKTKYHEYYN